MNPNERRAMPPGLISGVALQVVVFLISISTTEVCAADMSTLLPPDPGPAGKLTLAGIDSDGDGVRDDVQRWIALTCPNSQKTRAALTQRTKTMQQFLLSAANPVKSYAIAIQMGKDRSCLAYVQPQQYYRIAVENKAVVLNSNIRSKAWFQADHNLRGKMFSGLSYQDRKKGCNFNSDAMPN